MTIDFWLLYQLVYIGDCTFGTENFIKLVILTVKKQIIDTKSVHHFKLVRINKQYNLMILLNYIIIHYYTVGRLFMYLYIKNNEPRIGPCLTAFEKNCQN